MGRIEVCLFGWFCCFCELYLPRAPNPMEESKALLLQEMEVSCESQSKAPCIPSFYIQWMLEILDITKKAHQMESSGKFLSFQHSPFHLYFDLRLSALFRQFLNTTVYFILPLSFLSVGKNL